MDNELRKKLSALQDFEAEPKADTWLAIEKKIAKPNKRRPILFLLITCIVVAIASFTILRNLSNHSSHSVQAKSVVNLGTPSNTKSLNSINIHQNPSTEKTLSNNNEILTPVSTSASSHTLTSKENPLPSSQNTSTPKLQDLPIINNEKISTSHVETTVSQVTSQPSIESKSGLPPDLANKDINNDKNQDLSNFRITALPLITPHINVPYATLPVLQDKIEVVQNIKNKNSKINWILNITPAMAYDLVSTSKTPTQYAGSFKFRKLLDPSRITFITQLGIHNRLNNHHAITAGIQYFNQKTYLDYTTYTKKLFFITRSNDQYGLSTSGKTTNTEISHHLIGFNLGYAYSPFRQSALSLGTSIEGNIDVTTGTKTIWSNVNMHYPITNALFITPSLKYQINNITTSNQLVHYKQYLIGLGVEYRL
jgi:hypothetical protein